MLSENHISILFILELKTRASYYYIRGTSDSTGPRTWFITSKKDIELIALVLRTDRDSISYLIAEIYITLNHFPSKLDCIIEKKHVVVITDSRYESDIFHLLHS